MEDKKGEVVRLFREAASEDGPGAGISVTGDGNITVGGAVYGDIHQNATHRISTRFTPGPEHITAAQARRIQDLVANLATKEVAGGMPRAQAYSKWYGVLKSRYNVNSYMAIPAELGDEAISWLSQQGAIKRTKLRRPANQMWRNELYRAIWARSRQLGLSRGQVYDIVYTRLGCRVSSLTQLGERNLKRLHQIIMAAK